MSSDDEYLTIESKVQSEIKVKGSRFIGTAIPTGSLEEFDLILNLIVKEYYNATHHCYAFRIKTNNQIITKFSDAGEPAGTAGQPILNVISGRNLYDLAVVVTRYFGGTKLGKGGLVRAYSDCTQFTLDNCKIIKKYHLSEIILRFPNNYTGSIMHTISKFKGSIKSSIYSDKTQLTVEIPESLEKNLKNKLIELTSAKIEFE